MRRNKTAFLPIKLTKTDKDVLYFLWQHRLSTFPGLKQTFYPELTNEKAYYKLRRLYYCRLAANDFLIGTNNRIWKLGHYGFKYLALDKSSIKRYRIEHQYRNLLTMSVLRHPVGARFSKNIKIISQQELKTLNFSFLPKDFLGNQDHLCDGLWLFKDYKCPFALALEVETMTRSFDTYKKICTHYDKQPFVKYVVWVVDSMDSIEKILEASKGYLMQRENIHLFLLKRDVEDSPSSSTFIHSTIEQKTLAELLHVLAGMSLEKMESLRRVLDGSTKSAERDFRDSNFFLDFKYSLENLIALRKSKNQKSA